MSLMGEGTSTVLHPRTEPQVDPPRMAHAFPYAPSPSETLTEERGQVMGSSSQKAQHIFVLRDGYL